MLNYAFSLIVLLSGRYLIVYGFILKARIIYLQYYIIAIKIILSGNRGVYNKRVVH